MERFLFRVEVVKDATGWVARVRGTEVVWAAGPFAWPDDAHASVFGLVRRWQVRARTQGGFVWRPRGSEIGLALPAGARVHGALPFQHAPCCTVGTPSALPV